MEWLIQLDRTVFDLVNQDWQNGFMDAWLPWWREKNTWIPLYLSLAAFVAYRYRMAALPFLAALAITAGVSDAVSSHIVKPSVARVRPCNDPEVQSAARLLVGCGKAYSFPSSHAANHFSVAVFLALTLCAFSPFLRGTLYFWAASIAFGQVYVGVHYPLDVIGGAILGITIGNIVAKTYLRLVPDAIKTKRA